MAVHAYDAELTEVQRSIGRWRRSRTRASRMPEDLWGRAVALTKHRAVSRVATALGLGYYALRQRVEAAGGPPGFVEMRGAELLVDAPTGGGTMVEVRAGDGAQLTVRLANGASLDVAALVERFRGAHL